MAAPKPRQSLLLDQMGDTKSVGEVGPALSRLVHSDWLFLEIEAGVLVNAYNPSTEAELGGL